MTIDLKALGPKIDRELNGDPVAGIRPSVAFALFAIELDSFHEIPGKPELSQGSCAWVTNGGEPKEILNILRQVAQVYACSIEPPKGTA